MSNPAFLLLQLQKIDSRQDAIFERIKKIDSIRKSDQRLLIATNTRTEDEQSLKLIKGELDNLEQTIQNKRVKIEQSESSLYGGTVKNPKELQDLQKEIVSIINSIQILEDVQLSLLMKVEEAEKKSTASQLSLDVTTAIIQESDHGFIAELNKLQSEMENIQKERSAFVIQIPEKDRLNYVMLRSRKKGIAVSLVIDQSCSACGTTLTPAECQQVNSSQTLTYCSSCGRILAAG